MSQCAASRRAAPYRNGTVCAPRTAAQSASPLNGSEAMEAVIAVLRASDAFANIWPSLAAECGVGVRVSADAEELAPLGSAAGVIVSAGGVEAEAAARLASLSAQTRAPIVVAGAVADHRLAISLIRAGAADYIALPGELESLRDWVRSRAQAVRSAASAEALRDYEREQYDFSRL